MNEYAAGIVIARAQAFEKMQYDVIALKSSPSQITVTAQKTLERLAKVNVENSVYKRIKGGVDVAQPDNEVDCTEADLRLDVVAKRADDVHDEEG